MGQQGCVSRKKLVAYGIFLQGGLNIFGLVWFLTPFFSPETSHRAVGQLFGAILEIDGGRFQHDQRNGGGRRNGGSVVTSPVFESTLGTRIRNCRPTLLSFLREVPGGGGGESIEQKEILMGEKKILIAYS